MRSKPVHVSYLVAALVAVLGFALPVTQSIAAPFVTIDSILLDTPGDGTFFGTFQSHNQKVVANDNGIFVSYLHTSPNVTPNIWRLARSTDDGRTFTTIYEAQDFTRAPALETDENNNIYLAHPSWNTQQMKFLRFTPLDNYSVPDISKTFDGVVSFSKYAMVYDPSRQQFHIASQYSQLLTVDKSGNLLRDQQVFSQFADGAYSQYPYLFVGDDGVLHHAQTTEDENGLLPYETIRYVQSTDGGATWQTMAGTALSTPTTPGALGPSDMINLVDEIDMKSWLGTMHVKDGKAHFAYQASVPPDSMDSRNHYMRFDLATGTREIDTWSDTGDQWQGADLSMQTQSALMVSDPSKLFGPLYAVAGTSDGHLSALVSYDNGSMWQDFATSLEPFAGIYAVGGFREITDDGRIIGTFTAKIDIADPWRTYYFQILVPEPTSLTLLLLGCAALGFISLLRAFNNGRGGSVSWQSNLAAHICASLRGNVDGTVVPISSNFAGRSRSPYRYGATGRDSSPRVDQAV